MTRARAVPAALLVLSVLLAGCASDTATPPEGSPTCAPENTNCNGAAQPPPPPASPSSFPSSGGGPSPPAGSASPGPACAAGPMTLTHDVTDTTKLSHIIPPGNLAGGGTVKAHSHVFPKAPGIVPVHAPVALNVTKITHYRESGEAIYLLHMAADCRTTFRLDHLAKVAPKLEALSPPLREDTRNDDPPIAIPFEAGEYLGETGGGPASAFFDFGMEDAAVTNANVQNASALLVTVHAVCPYERFVPELRVKYLGLLGTPDGKLVAGAPCRSPARDVPGTLQGSWFLAGASNDVGARAAIAPDLDGTVFFTLTSPSGERVDLRDAGSRDPATVGPGEVVCYQSDTGGYVGQYGWARLSGDARSVALAWGAGACPTGEPPGAVTYYR